VPGPCGANSFCDWKGSGTDCVGSYKPGKLIYSSYSILVDTDVYLLQDIALDPLILSAVISLDKSVV
jgi:hypothetical protein